MLSSRRTFEEDVKDTVFVTYVRLMSLDRSLCGRELPREFVGIFQCQVELLVVGEALEIVSLFVVQQAEKVAEQPHAFLVVGRDEHASEPVEDISMVLHLLGPLPVDVEYRSVLIERAFLVLNSKDRWITFVPVEHLQVVDHEALQIGKDPVHSNGFRPLVGLSEFRARLHEELHVGNQWSE